MLTVDNATKTYSEHLVFSDLNFSVEAHQIVGIAGSSGSGKSTLLRCIQGLEPLTSGQIKVGGKSALMFQDFQLFPHMTVLDNLVYAPTLNDKAIDHQSRAYQLLETLNLADKAKAYPSQLSGGQKQRVALMRALMVQPCLLSCDEPTSGLDVLIVDEVAKLLKSVQAMGLTLIVASHDLPFLLNISDRLLILKAGELVLNETTLLLKKNKVDLRVYL